MPSVSVERGGMAVSVVVVAYNIRRELPRTLLSLSAAYQQHIAPEDYEIVVVDNGSCPPLDEAMWKGLLGNFRLISPPAAPPSPARAINIGLAEARGDVIGVMIDGARIATPGVLHFARHATDLYDTAVVTVLGWYLGLDFQIYAVSGGYDTAREDALLETIGWPENGYRLFEIATPDESSLGSGLVPIAESNCLFLKRASWDRLGGADECFESPGGGLLNHDIYARALELPGAQPVVLLGEGTFHQLHGGISTNSALEELPKKVDVWVKEYKRLRARAPWKHSQPMRPTFLGTLPPAALARLSRDAIKSPPPARPPLGERFDAGLWAFDLPPRPAHPAVAALTDLAHRELRAGRYECAAAVARLARPHAPDDPELQRVLSIVGPWLDARHGHPCTFV